MTIGTRNLPTSRREFVGKSEVKPIVVNAPSFDETGGGSIALHYLVDRLRNIGLDAYVYPILFLDEYPKWPGLRPAARLMIFLRNLRRRMMLTMRFRTHPSMDTPIASKKMLRNSVAVYPEIVSGNPLRAKYVVRWLLHRPGFLKKNVIFGSDEFTFFFQDAFREGHEWVDPDNLLRVRWVRDDIYFNRGFPERSGACRLIRKGKLSGSLAPAEDDAIIIDDMSHEEKAEIFNRCKFLYCHDPYTMYCLYAALCGCIPVVIPQPDLSKEDWRSTYPFKHGIAYGIEEAQWAADTRNELLEELAAQQSLEDEMLRNFASKLEAKFRFLNA
jgi:hypothetical protein